MIKINNKTFTHRFLLGAMCVLFVLQSQELFSQLAIQDSIIKSKCSDTKDAYIKLKVKGGVLPYSYSWSNGGNTELISGLNAGFYTVTVSDSSVPELSLIKTYVIKPTSQISLETFYPCRKGAPDGSFIGSPIFYMTPLTFPIYHSLTEVKDTGVLANINLPILTKSLAAQNGNGNYYSYETKKYFRSEISDNYDPNLFLRLYVKDSNNCVLDTIFPAFEKYDYLNLDLIPDTVSCPSLVEGPQYLEFKSNLPRSSITYLHWLWEEKGVKKECWNCDKIPIQAGINEYKIQAGRSCYIFFKYIYVDCPIYNNPQFIFLPTAFSPNGDGINDLFFLNSVSGIVNRIERIAVYNRWGALVYEQKDIDPNDTTQGWDGLVRGIDATSDVYACYAELRLYDGSTKVVKGNVMLVR